MKGLLALIAGVSCALPAGAQEAPAGSGSVCFTESASADGLNASRRAARLAVVKAFAMRIDGVSLKSLTATEKRSSSRRVESGGLSELSEARIEDDAEYSYGGYGLPPIAFRWEEPGSEAGEPPRVVATLTGCVEPAALRQAVFDVSVMRLKSLRDAGEAASQADQKAQALAELRMRFQLARARFPDRPHAEALSQFERSVLAPLEREANRLVRIGAHRYSVFVQGPPSTAIPLKQFILARSTGVGVGLLLSAGSEAAAAFGVPHPALLDLLRDLRTAFSGLPDGLSKSSDSDGEYDLRLFLPRTAPSVWSWAEARWRRRAAGAAALWSGRLRTGRLQLFATQACRGDSALGQYLSRGEEVEVIQRGASGALRVRLPDGFDEGWMEPADVSDERGTLPPARPYAAVETPARGAAPAKGRAK